MGLATPTIVLLFLTTLACGNSRPDEGNDKTGTASAGAAGEIDDTSALGITAFLRQASYRGWGSRQAAPIVSVRSHAAKTQTYFNDLAADAARVAQDPLPKGSVVVKDIYESDGVTLRGQALMAKVEEGEGGGTWVWFEGFLPDYDGPYYGKGLATCTGCHAAGADFVRTAVPPAIPN